MHAKNPYVDPLQRKANDPGTWERFCLQSEPDRAPPMPKPKREKSQGSHQFSSYEPGRFDPPPATNEELTFRHSAWKVKRGLVQIGLQAAGTSPQVMDRFVNCGGGCVVEYCKETGRYRCRGSYCKSRHCEPCQKARGNLLAANLRKKLEDGSKFQFRFFTFTLKHNDKPLREQVDRLYACFKQLRKEPLWKGTQKGGAVVLEVKWNPEKDEWHPHLHVTSEGLWVNQNRLMEKWYAITGDSFKIDVRELKTAKDAAYYVAKYMGKGCNSEVWTDEARAVEWISNMKGRRSCATYGTWRGFKLLESTPDEGEWKHIGTLNDIVRRAIANEPWAVGVMLSLNREVKYDPHRKRDKKNE